jgi:hypothetical protein
MSTYRRDRVPGGSYFFTVNLCDRNSRLLVTEIDKLRHAVSTAREQHPFHIDAWVVLPNHLHCLWTLPPDDTRPHGLHPFQPRDTRAHDSPRRLALLTLPPMRRPRPLPRHLGTPRLRPTRHRRTTLNATNVVTS